MPHLPVRRLTTDPAGAVVSLATQIIKRALLDQRTVVGVGTVECFLRRIGMEWVLVAKWPGRPPTGQLYFEGDSTQQVFPGCPQLVIKGDSVALPQDVSDSVAVILLVVIPKPSSDELERSEEEGFPLVEIHRSMLQPDLVGSCERLSQLVEAPAPKRRARGRTRELAAVR